MNLQIILLIFVSLASLAGLAWSLINLWRAIWSQNWDQIDCVITESRVEIRRLRHNTRYIPIIHYKYNVSAQSYEGSNLKYGGTWSFKSASYGYCDKYTTGKTVKVNVDPKDPKRSVLEPGASLRSYFSVIIAIAFGAVGLMILLN